MSQSAQSRWPVAQNLGMSEENFVYYYPMCSTSGGRKKADCIRDLQNAGMTPQQAQIFWDVVKTKKYDSKVN